MRYILVDLSSQYYVAANPYPNIKFLLREHHDCATQYASRQEALSVMEEVAAYFKGHYRDLELAVKPAGSRKKHTAHTPMDERRGYDDPADRYNEQVVWMDAYDRDMS